MKALVALAAAIAVIHLSPGARSWLGELLMVLGVDLMNSCPEIMTEEQRRRGLERSARDVAEARGRAERNGGRP